MADKEVIKIFEDTFHKVDLTQQQIKDVLELKNIVGDQNVILQADGRICINHYVGFYQKNDTRLLIYPKISRRIEDECVHECAFNILMQMLIYTGYMGVKKLEMTNLQIYQGDLLEVFIGYFVQELISHFKRDVNRNYRHYSENQCFIKGKIDFSETIKKNSFRKHLHHVKYELFTEDILMNQIFKTVIIHLIRKTKVQENKKALQLGLLWLEDVDTVSLRKDIWEQVRFTRLNSQYKTSYQMAKLLYHNSGPHLNKGDESTLSFLIPVNKLFEKFVYEKLKSTAQNGEEYQFQDARYHLVKQGSQKWIPLRPDIVRMCGKEVIGIIDAKYKEILDGDGKLNLSNSDLYQMLAYSVKYQCESIQLYYPRFLHYRTNEKVEPLEMDNYGHKVIVEVVIVDLEEPSC